MFISALLLLYSSGVDLSKDQLIIQNPTDLIVKPNQEVQLRLEQKSKGYDVILWYQRSPGNSALKLIGYKYRSVLTMEAAFKNQFNLTGDGSSAVNLSMTNPRHPEDSGEYYGAASSPQQ